MSRHTVNIDRSSPLIWSNMEKNFSFRWVMQS
jgi:hypothetical protein